MIFTDINKLNECKMQESNIMLQIMIDVANMVFKYLILLNGSAIISILTFLGNSKIIQNFSNLWFWALSLYSTGILFVMTAIFFAFWAQKIFREGCDKDAKQGEETSSLIIYELGIKKRNVSIYLSILSLSLFFSGCILSLCAFSNSF